MAVTFRIHACAVLAAVLALVAGPAFAQSLSLEEALRLGELQSPRLAAQRSAVAATSEQVGRAAQLPDPKVRLGIENLPVSGADRFRYDRDFMTSRNVGFVQEFPNAAKREARNVRAERMRDVEGATLQAQRVFVQRDVALAWLDAHYAERAGEALERLASQFRLQIDAVPSGIAVSLLRPGALADLRRCRHGHELGVGGDECPSPAAGLALGASDGQNSTTGVRSYGRGDLEQWCASCPCC